MACDWKRCFDSEADIVMEAPRLSWAKLVDDINFMIQEGCAVNSIINYFEENDGYEIALNEPERTQRLIANLVRDMNNSFKKHGYLTRVSMHVGQTGYYNMYYGLRERQI